jgi:hypothetical protein
MAPPKKAPEAPPKKEAEVWFVISSLPLPNKINKDRPPVESLYTVMKMPKSEAVELAGLFATMKKIPKFYSLEDGNLPPFSPMVRPHPLLHPHPFLSKYGMDSLLPKFRSRYEQVEILLGKYSLAVSVDEKSRPIFDKAKERAKAIIANHLDVKAFEGPSKGPRAMSEHKFVPLNDKRIPPRIRNPPEKKVEAPPLA